jgi:hypothetical protein
MRLPGQSDKPGNPDSQIIPELILFASIIAHYKNKKGALSPQFSTNLIAVCYYNHYLFITYIVTSKPNLISVAAGDVHIIFSFSKSYTHRVYDYILLLKFPCEIEKIMINRQRKTRPKPG